MLMLAKLVEFYEVSLYINLVGATCFPNRLITHH